MSETSQGSAAARVADTAFFDLLRQELEHRKQGEAAHQLRGQLKLRVAAELPAGPNTLVKFKVAHRLTEYNLRLNAVDGEVLSWYIDFLAKDGDSSLPPEQALELARAVAAPSDDAKLTTSGYDSTSGRMVFRARWEHRHDDLPVEGDFIEVLINGKARKPFAMTRVWRAPRIGAKAVER